MDNAIGIFDSGLGGLTVFKELSNILPNENIVYFGDTGRVPYGSKSTETIVKYAEQDIRFLSKFDVKMLVAACGTVSSVISQLKINVPTPFTGVVMPTVAAAYRATHNKKIGVIGTSATIQSCSYTNCLKSLDPSIQVFEQDCPLFVSLVENGFVSAEDPIVKLTVERYLSNIKKNKVDTLILGCTHYPLLESSISKEMGENVKLINSGKETALHVAKKLRESGLLNKNNSQPTYQFYVSDGINNFAKHAKLFLKKEISDKVKQIDIGQY